jgi:dolichyl-phosphate beta-glucosyltransferase
MVRLIGEDLMTESIAPLVSIIIPAYNEAKRLPATLDSILAWMRTMSDPIELVIVENGSQDETTRVAQSYQDKFPLYQLLHSIKGKGAAVQTGILHSQGVYLFICDSDLSMPIEEVEKFLSCCRAGADIAIGSREAHGAVRYNEPAYRHLMGRVFNTIVRIAAIPRLQDTQCGFKMFRQDAAKQIFSQLRITGWAFDVEALYLAGKQGYSIVEVPIDWYFNPDSRVDPIRDMWRMLSDLLKIRLNDLRGEYRSPHRNANVVDHLNPNRS